MIKLSKRMCTIQSSFDRFKEYNFVEGISVLKKLSTVNFVESVDVSVSLGIDPRKSEQNIRSNVFLPHSIGRDLFIVVFTQGVNVELAKDAGANLVGLDNLIDYVKNKKNKIDVVIATPDVMKTVSQWGSFLGPRGLMPNLKFGTVSQNVVETIQKIKIGQIRYRNDKYGIVHASIGKISFDVVQLKENFEFLLLDLKKNKPAQSKGVYFRKVMISSTMGPSLLIDQKSVF